MKTKILGLLTIVLLAGPMAANAYFVTWQLDGVTFTDGGTAVGSFGYDADTNVFANINITTSVNGSLGATYGVPTGVGSATFFDTLTSFPASGEPRLLLFLSQSMTNAGGTIAVLLTSLEGICTSNTCGSVSPYRFVTAGNIASVPEPGTLALLGLGLFGLGLSRRRKA